jgi:Holliday junction resolvase RusA-like endonuclease
MNDEIQIIEQISSDSLDDEGGQLFLIPPSLPLPPEDAPVRPIQEAAQNAGGVEVIDLLSSSGSDDDDDDSTTGVPVSVSVAEPSKKKAKNKKATKHPRFSFDEHDAFDVGTGEFRFTIRGKPCVLERPRFTGAHVYSASGPKKIDFRNACKNLFDRKSIAASSEIFEIDQPIKVGIVIREPRPMGDFIGQGRAGRSFDKLRGLARRLLGKGHGDVDNYAKFVLDALEGLCYANDKQVVVLSAARVLDNEGDCLGAVDIFLKKINERDARYECESMLEVV